MAPSSQPPELEGLRGRLNDQFSTGLRLRNKYQGAAVLALYWEAADDAGYEKEATDVVGLFRDKLHYHAEAFAIPSNKSQKAQKALSKRIIDFIDVHDGEERLLVVHYGGHGDENADRALDDERRSVWAAQRADGPTVDWFDIQQHFNHTDSDVLMMLDCCHASQSARDTLRFELLAGCAMKRETLPPGRNSFTTAVLREIEELLTRGGQVEVSELYNRLINRRGRLSETPIYVPIPKKRARDGIWLTPIDPGGVIEEQRKEGTEIYSLWMNITVEGSMDSDATLFQDFTNWIRRGLPQTVSGLEVEKVLVRAEKLRDITYHKDQMMKGQPLLQAMDCVAQLHIRRLWRPMKGVLLQAHASRAADALMGALVNVGSLRRRLMGLVQRVDAQNEVLTEAIGQGATTSYELDKDILGQLEHDAMAESSGLAETFRLQRLVKFTGISNNPPQIEADDVRPINKIPGINWQMESAEKSVVVERKFYQNTDQAPIIEMYSERVQKLANLLAAEKAESFNSLTCMHWFHDDYQHFFGLVFQIPSYYKPFAIPLSDFLKPGIRLPLAPLEERFSMATSLCRALQKWHAVNWLHKGIRSDSIFVFQNKESNAMNFARPFLSGHECARPNQAISTARFVEDFKDNVYRHPDRQGLPRDNHKKIHDIYSLGVVLLEIGLWKPATDFREFREFRGGVAQLTKEAMRDALVSNAKQQRLSHNMGSGYQAAVIQCLTGDLGAEIDDVRSELQLALNFKKRVFDRIAKGIDLS